MTEKRFIVVDDYTIVDIEEERLISTDEIVDKMNELYEENIMLKNIKKDKIIKRDYTSMGLYDNKTEKENEQLKKENKELKAENEQLKKDGLYWGQNAEARLKEIDKLRKDNNILKQQRDYLFDVIDEVLPHSGSTTAYNRMQDIGDLND